MLDAGRELRYDETTGDVGGEDTEYVLLPGDTLMAKTTIAYQTAMGDAWSTFGAQTRVLEDESVDQAFDRLASITNSGVIELSKDAVERVNAEVENTPRPRINPRH